MDILVYLQGIARGLKGQGPAALLAIGLLGAYMWGVGHSYDAGPLLLVVLLLWSGFLYRDIRADRHAERMKELDIRQIEAQGENLKRPHRRRTPQRR